MRLSRTVRPGEMEPATSFLSRLALRNGCPSQVVFCADMGLDLRRIRMGDTGEIQRMADLAGADGAALLRWSVQTPGPGAARTSERNVLETAGPVDRRCLARTPIRVCPDCLGEDAAEHDGLPPRRLPWKLLSLRSCPRHDRPLLTLPGARNPLADWDFAPAVLREAAVIRAAAEVPPRTCSAFEHHLIARLRGDAGDGWFAGLALPVAGRVAETLGVLLLQGADARMARQTEDTLHRAAAAGYAVLAGGPAALTAALEALIPSFGGRRVSYMETFGAFHAFLHAHAKDPELAPVIAVVRPLILERFAVVEGLPLYGAPAPRNHIFTIHTARTRLNIGVKALSTLLVARGLAVRDAETGLARPPDYLTREVLEDIRRELEDVIDEAQAARRLGIGIGLLRRLVEAGIVRRDASLDFGARRYRRSEIDRLLAGLRRDGGPIAAPGPGQVRLLQAAQPLQTSPDRLIRLLCDGELRSTGWLTAETGLSALVIDMAEAVVALAETSDRRRGIRRGQLAIELRVDQTTLAALIDQRYLTLCTGIDMVQGNGARLIDRASVQRFDAVYVSLRGLAAERGCPWQRLRPQLRQHGLRPLPLGRGCLLYRRQDIAAWDAEMAEPEAGSAGGEKTRTDNTGGNVDDADGGVGEPRTSGSC